MTITKDAPRMSAEELERAQAWMVANVPQWLSGVIARALAEADVGPKVSAEELAVLMAAAMSREWESADVDLRKTLVMMHVLQEQTGGASYEEVFSLALDLAEQSGWIRQRGLVIEVNPALRSALPPIH